MTGIGMNDGNWIAHEKSFLINGERENVFGKKRITINLPKSFSKNRNDIIMVWNEQDIK